MKILFCTGGPPYPLICGGSLIVANLAAQLSRGNDVFLLSLTRDDNDRENARIVEEEGIFEDVSTIHLPDARGLGKWIDRILVDPKRYVSLRYPKFHQAFLSQVSEVVKAYGIDVIHVHGSLMSLLLMECDAAPKVAALIDSMALHLRKDIELSSGFSHWLSMYLCYKTQRIEHYILEKYTSVVVVSLEDAAFLESLGGKASIEVIPHGVDSDFFHPTSVEKGSKEKKSILFFGNMSYGPNEDAVVYICTEILPLIKSRLANVTLYIVGAYPSAMVKKLGSDESVVVTGFVDDIRDYVAQADVVLVPMRKGSGIKDKILEAMAMGKAVVTNSIGAEGLSREARQRLTVVDDPKGIALRVEDLLQDPTKRGQLGKMAREIVLCQYPWNLCAQRYEEVYRRVIR